MQQIILLAVSMWHSPRVMGSPKPIECEIEISQHNAYFQGVNGVVVRPRAQSRKIKSSSIAGELLIPQSPHMLIVDRL